MRLELTALTSLLVLTGFATANVWNPDPEIDRSFENSDWEIIVKDMEAGGGTLEAKKNQEGKRTMYLDRRSFSEMMQNCRVLYSNSITTEDSPCPDYRDAVTG